MPATPPIRYILSNRNPQGEITRPSKFSLSPNIPTTW